mmetsp:Transcript_25469/g.46022  ORF Transcript_25469/g.46022 Transcript_25469/m.46022 type:complete len:170 (-) Transcript_25469:3624-4133(-)
MGAIKWWTSWGPWGYMGCKGFGSRSGYWGNVAMLVRELRAKGTGGGPCLVHTRPLWWCGGNFCHHPLAPGQVTGGPETKPQPDCYPLVWFGFACRPPPQGFSHLNLSTKPLDQYQPFPTISLQAQETWILESGSTRATEGSPARGSSPLFPIPRPPPPIYTCMLTSGRK